MFTHMVLVKRETHLAHNASYELLVYQVEESGEYQIYIAKDGFGVGDIFTASQEVARDEMSFAGVDIVHSLLESAKGDIDRNEYGLY